MQITRRNASTKGASVAEIDRKKVRNEIIQAMLMGELSQGEALRKLRIEMFGINQQHYIQLVKVSRQTLSNIENDKGNYSVETINKVFKPFGLELGLVPVSKVLLKELFSTA
ncbi:TPA: helix-turn-helix transcriptional regulator [Pasteurella multocida]|uniref:helix-turn-helix transcriptional regulator n=1 Tax=Pasteurella multocida TaxID=747 RepID=UPI0020209ACE|nr:helix-turn-helix transcriptional regulator [Pasteurella multocida]MCL7825659.1 helix-turn-helix domain-containing protein [Pasteurella multocida]URI04084.1 helix-turn-helix domain-containing protein [Pasteurella multocida]WND41332.1 helix-turn-helix transcriptional regulator [Pasteurella multocida]WND43393.1 helix-turn-helix transcriptional regulator [Pasteurella multocida]HDR1185231.1 helix-turn-helix transcriptional regulator [Pasteurella multocida]